MIGCPAWMDAYFKMNIDEVVHYHHYFYPGVVQGSNLKCLPTNYAFKGYPNISVIWGTKRPL